MPKDTREAVQRAEAQVRRYEREVSTFAPNGEINSMGAAARLRLGHARAELDRAIAAAGGQEGVDDE